MTALYSRHSNTRFRVVLALAATLAVGLPCFGMVYVRMPYATGQHFAPEQPVTFDHRHHARDDGIDCRYCHDTVERAATAGMPSTERCMGCHAQIWPTSPLLAPVRESWDRDRPIRWMRVNRLPEFVYFDHSIHLARGIGCSTCHGRVDRMPVTRQAEPLTMGWCLDCHQHPEPHLRPFGAVTDMDWTPASEPPGAGEQRARERGIRHLVNCTTCHR